MKSLGDAIVTAFLASPTLVAAFPGGLHPDEAPEGTTRPPYLVYRVLAAPSNSAYGNADLFEVYVRFQAIGVGWSATGTVMQTFLGVFDNAILPLSTGAVCDARTEGQPIPTLYTPRDDSGNELWSWSTEFVYSIRDP